MRKEEKPHNRNFMRFILHFIFYGLLFYAIYLFFPEAFTKLVSWAGDAFNFIKSAVEQLIQSIQNAKSSS